MDIFNIDKLSLFLFFFVPGFVSTKVWNLLVPTEKRKITDYMLETISYSCINFAVLSWLINIISNKDFVSNHPVWLKLLTFIILFVFPIIWPMLIKFILSWDFFKGHIVHPTPRAWDRFFGLGHPCFVLIHLNFAD
ncbi:DUF6338 family protein [Acetivibrio mesophilus]|uniref:Uncharacterized protein n=1 Tax=Acetivibrio mesophilus TaxID=2487273 RepID=A0A4Q0I2X1_9FIRM|nr:hypothetical protein EFD62_14695 [Acetivibrio mesophilus]